MTGGGSVFNIDDLRVTRDFQIHCDLREPNNLEVNWPQGNVVLSRIATWFATSDSCGTDARRAGRSAAIECCTAGMTGPACPSRGARVAESPG
jgi:hypothetical protein